MAKIGRITTADSPLPDVLGETVVLPLKPTAAMRRALKSFEGSEMFPGGGSEDIWSAVLRAAKVIPPLPRKRRQAEAV